MWVIWSALIGVGAGWLAGRFLRGNGFGLLGDIAAGVVGAVIGGYVLRIAGIDLGAGLIARLTVASFGAATVLFLVHTLTGRRAGRRLWS